MKLELGLIEREPETVEAPENVCAKNEAVVPQFALLGSLAGSRRGFAASLGCSAVLHAVVGLGVPFLFAWAGLLDDPEPMLPQMAVRMVRGPLLLAIPDRAVARLAMPAMPLARRRPADGSAAASGGAVRASDGRELKPAALLIDAPKLAMPAARARVQELEGAPGPTLLQPSMTAPPAKPPEASIVVWSGPSPKRRAFIPGSPSPRMDRGALMAAPNLDLMTAAPGVAQTQAPMVVQTGRGPVLPPAGGAPPLIAHREATAGGAPGEQNYGERAALVADAGKNPKPGETLEVPEGRRVGGSGKGAKAAVATPASGDAAAKAPVAQGEKAEGSRGGGAADGQVANGTSAAGKLESAAAVLKGGSGGGTVVAAGNGSGSSSRGGTPDGRTDAGETGAAAGAAKGPVTGTIKTGSGLINLTDLPDGTRQIKYPVNGQFDVVVLTTASNLAAEMKALLSGSPVYSVFLNVGAAKEWVMQYCMPGGGKKGEQEGMVVSLAPEPVVKAPFVLQAVLPLEEEKSGAQSKAVVYGKLGVDGRLAELRTVQGGSGLLPYLRRWQFRPATKDGVPAEIELVLEIPATNQGKS